MNENFRPHFTQKELEEFFEEIINNEVDMGKEWDKQLQKYRNMLLYSKDKESIEKATDKLASLFELLKKKEKISRFKGPMFSVKEEVLSDEFAEAAAKKMNKVLFPIEE